jgi:DNA invertase Pin-like site-specific DNA recombinase
MSKYRFITPKQRETVISLRKEGFTYDDIVKKTGVKRSTLEVICRKVGLLTSKGQRANRDFKVLKLFSAGVTIKEIVKGSGLPYETVYRILKVKKASISTNINSHASHLPSIVKKMINPLDEFISGIEDILAGYNNEEVETFKRAVTRKRLEEILPKLKDIFQFLEYVDIELGDQ